MKITLTQFRPNTAEAVWTDCFAQAIAELHKAGGGVLTVPTGEYSTGPIELCSNIELHLEPGAVIRFLNDPAAFPLQECQYEGRISHRPKPCLSAFNAENVALCAGWLRCTVVGCPARPHPSQWPSLPAAF